VVHVKAEAPSREAFRGEVALGNDRRPLYVRRITSGQGEEISFGTVSIALYGALMQAARDAVAKGGRA